MKISSRLLLFSFILLRSILYCCTLDSSIQSINIEDPQLSIKPTPLESYTPKDYKGALSCERVHFIPRSRLKLESYASSVHLTLAPSVVIPEKLHTRIQICLHMNASIGICQCEKDAWKTVHKGIWGSVISPYEEKYIDVKFIGDIKGSVTISIEEELQRWRIICLVAGIILLLIAPIVSMWVPFYYSSTMAIGILLVVIILLFQGMKLLPAGRKNAFYLTVYGSLLGAGSFLLHQFSMLVNSILLNFGFSEEMHNPLSIFLLVGIVLAGAGLGYWIVQRFVISDDGSVDVGIAQFVKWAMRIIASTLILQGTSDTLFAWTTVLLCWLICSLLPSFKWPNSRDQSIHWRKAEFLRKTPKATPPRMVLKSPNTPNWRSSTTRDMISHGLIPSSTRRMNAQKHYYSSFHNVPKPKMSKKQWEEFTRESTRNAMAELTSSPEFSEWMIENANRIQIRADDSSDDTAASGSDSTDETIVDNGPRRGLFNW